MADSFGLLPQGLLIPTLDDLRSGYDADFRTEYGPDFPLGDGTLAGFLSGGLSERLALLWNQLQLVVDSSNRDAASNAALKALGILNGTIAPVATFSTVTLTLCGDPGETVLEGYSGRTPTTKRVFTVQGDTPLVTLSARLSATVYAVRDRVTNSLRCYQCTVGGTTGTSGDAPTTTDLDILDGTVHWTYIGDGTAAADALAFCDVTGPVEAGARSITEPFTPVPGINTVTNLLDADPGQDELSDEDLRLLIEADIATPGTGTGAAIAADLRQVSGVTSVTVFENESNVTDPDGVPPHCFEILVQGGDDQAIRDSILSNKPAGIGTTGSVTGTATDDEGKVHTIKFSRPVEIPIYVDVTLTKDPATYSGDDAVKAAVAAAPRVIGRSVVSSRLSALAFGVSGVFDIPRSGSLLGVLISVAPSPTSDATIVITSRQLATYDITRVTVHSSDA